LKTASSWNRDDASNDRLFGISQSSGLIFSQMGGFLSRYILSDKMAPNLV